MVRAALALISALCVISAAGCGDGSSNSSTAGAARVALSVDPKRLDVGDRVEVRINIEDVDEAGIILKVRIPTELAYIVDSAVHYYDDDERELAPAQIETDDDVTYIIFRIDEDENGEENRSTLVFDLRANDGKDEVTIAIDPDVNSTTPFDPLNPEFVSEAQVEVSVDE